MACFKNFSPFFFRCFFFVRCQMKINKNWFFPITSWQQHNWHTYKNKETEVEEKYAHPHNPCTNKKLFDFVFGCFLWISILTKVFFFFIYSSPRKKANGNNIDFSFYRLLSIYYPNELNARNGKVFRGARENWQNKRYKRKTN